MSWCVLQPRVSLSAANRELSGQELELHIQLVNRQLQKGEEAVIAEAREWECKAKAATQMLDKLERKLAAYPRRFMQTVEEARAELRRLEDVRDRLEGEARGEREGLHERLHKARGELALAEAEYERVQEEEQEVEEDRGYWRDKASRERVRVEMLEKSRAALLAKLKPLGDGRGVERVCYDKVRLLAMGLEGQVEGDEAFVTATATALDQFFAPEMDVMVENVREAVERVCAGAVPAGFEEFCALVDEVRRGAGGEVPTSPAEEKEE